MESMGDLSYAFSVIAYVPMGVMLAAVAVPTVMIVRARRGA
jgi:hypothetical protein